MLVAAERADRSTRELKDLLAGQWHAATVGAMKLGGDARVVPLAQQSDLQFGLSEQLIPTKHLAYFRRTQWFSCQQLWSH